MQQKDCSQKEWWEYLSNGWRGGPQCQSTPKGHEWRYEEDHGACGMIQVLNQLYEAAILPSVRRRRSLSLWRQIDAESRQQENSPSMGTSNAVRWIAGPPHSFKQLSFCLAEKT
jgi:hypothetical protein